MGLNIELLDKRITELDNLSKEVAQQDTTSYKDRPKYLKDLEKAIDEQKKICQEEKALIKEYNVNQKDIKALEEAEVKRKKDYDDAQLSHRKLKLDLVKKYPECYDRKTGIIDVSKCPDEAQRNHQMSKRHTLATEEDLKDTETELNQKKERNKQVALRYNELVKKNPELHKNKRVAEPCVECLQKKIQEQDPQKHWIKFSIKDAPSKPLSNVSIKIILPDDNVYNGQLKEEIHIKNIEQGRGSCKIESNWKELRVDQVVFLQN
jgi:hypothetical protein